MKKFFSAIAVVGSLALVSCNTDTPKLVVDDKFVPQSQKLDLSKEGLVSQLDVLFVVDDSGSMDDKQRLLATNIALFTQEFTKSAFVDYHVGVITSSIGSRSTYECGKVGCNGALVGPPNWIERSTPNAITTLQNNFMVGTSGSGNEEFFDPVVMALTSPVMDNENKGFYRPRAHLAVIFVTDADDQSQSRITPDKFIDFLKKLKGRDDNFSIYAAYIPSNDRTCNRSGEPYPDRLEDLFKKTKAITVNLCDAQFGKKLAEVGKDLFHRVARKMYLARRPVKDTIRVTYGSITLPSDAETGWMYEPNQNVITFGPKVDWESQPQGSNLDIEYTPIKDPT